MNKAKRSLNFPTPASAGCFAYLFWLPNIRFQKFCSRIRHLRFSIHMNTSTVQPRQIDLQTVTFSSDPVEFIRFARRKNSDFQAISHSDQRFLSWGLDSQISYNNKEFFAYFARNSGGFWQFFEAFFSAIPSVPVVEDRFCRLEVINCTHSRGGVQGAPTCLATSR
jgi:hypothetical protein